MLAVLRNLGPCMLTMLAVLLTGPLTSTSCAVAPLCQIESFKTVVENTQSRDEDVRLNAILQLVNYPDHVEEAIDLACELTMSRDSIDRVAAEIVLKDFGPLVVPRAMAMLDDEDINRYGGACNALANTAPDSESAVPDLVKLLNSGDPQKMFASCFALKEMGSAASPALPQCTKLLKHENFNLQIQVCHVIAQMGGDAATATDPLLELAANGNPSARSTTAIALGAIGAATEDPRIVELLSEMLDSKLSIERERALIGAGNMGPAASDLLPKVESLINDRKMSVMPEAAFARWQITNDAQTSLEILEPLTVDRTYGLRAIDHIAKMGSAGAPTVETLSQQLDNEDASIREAVLRALIEIGPAARSTKDKLKKMAQADEDVLVRRFAVDALQAIAK